MTLALCVKTFRGGTKAFFEKGNEYHYTKHDAPNGSFIYSLTGERTDYITMFGSVNNIGTLRCFSLYFIDKKKIRDEKITDLLKSNDKLL